MTGSCPSLQLCGAFPVCRGQHLAKVVQGRNGGEAAAGSWAEEVGSDPTDELLWFRLLRRFLLMESCKRHKASQLFASSGANGGVDPES